jgi:U3 small nucleolar ribonucleoprotein protein IMP4
MLGIISRHHVFVKTSPKEVQLAEVGPRFELKRGFFELSSWQSTHLIGLLAYEIRQGTIEQTEAEREWVLSHYTRTARKRSMLSNPTASRPDNDEQVDNRPSKKRSH